MPVQKMTKCPVCHGAGQTSAGKPCKRCKGSGEVNALSKRSKSAYSLNGARASRESAAEVLPNR